MAESLENKTCISLLQEFCQKKLCAFPEYEFDKFGIETYRCKVRILDSCGYGFSNSKKQAKHIASEKLWKILEETETDICEQMNKTVPRSKYASAKTDLVVKLRNLCIGKRIALPTYEIIQKPQADGQDYVAQCTVGCIQRAEHGASKKEARDNVTKTMMIALNNVRTNTLKKNSTYILEPRRKNNFKFCYKDVCNVLTGNYSSARMQVLDLLHVLKISRDVIDVTEAIDRKIVSINIHEFNIVFTGGESVIYSSMISYFRDKFLKGRRGENQQLNNNETPIE